jgi:hypothetical protein
MDIGVVVVGGGGGVWRVLEFSGLRRLHGVFREPEKSLHVLHGVFRELEISVQGLQCHCGERGKTMRGWQ